MENLPFEGQILRLSSETNLFHCPFLRCSLSTFLGMGGRLVRCDLIPPGDCTLDFGGESVSSTASKTLTTRSFCSFVQSHRLRISDRLSSPISQLEDLFAVGESSTEPLRCDSPPPNARPPTPASNSSLRGLDFFSSEIPQWLFRQFLAELEESSRPALTSPLKSAIRLTTSPLRSPEIAVRFFEYLCSCLVSTLEASHAGFSPRQEIAEFDCLEIVSSKLYFEDLSGKRHLIFAGIVSESFPDCCSVLFPEILESMVKYGYRIRVRVIGLDIRELVVHSYDLVADDGVVMIETGGKSLFRILRVPLLELDCFEVSIWQPETNWKRLLNSLLNSICSSAYELSGMDYQSELALRKQTSEFAEVHREIIDFVKTHFGIGTDRSKFIKFKNKFSVNFEKVFLRTNMAVIFLGKKSEVVDGQSRKETPLIIKVMPFNLHSFNEKTILTDIGSSGIPYLPECDFLQFGEFCYLFMEKLDSFDVGALQWAERLDLMIEMCCAIQSFHRRHILLNDLKLDHFMRRKSTNPDRESDQLKLIDFNLTVFFRKEVQEDGREFLLHNSSSIDLPIENFDGTDLFMAPEKRRSEGGDGIVSTRTDVYPLGIVFLQVFFGCEDDLVVELKDAFFRRFLRDCPPAHLEVPILEEVSKLASKVDVGVEERRISAIFTEFCGGCADLPCSILTSFLRLIRRMTMHKKEERATVGEAIEVLRLIASHFRADESGAESPDDEGPPATAGRFILEESSGEEEEIEFYDYWGGDE